jgi:glycerol-3-phosphate O-acyltransferase/dihydroxyacetone phosphate acyltransferase
LWRRKSATGAVDAQGWGFSHPMTWLDERLFGWSRSARRGTSAWGGASSLDASRAATPDVSDDEEEGDYDNVIDYLGSYIGANLSMKRSRSKSLRGSYADLQQLKMKGSGSDRDQDGLLKPVKSPRATVSFAQSQYAPVYHKRPTPFRSPSSPQTSTSSTTSSPADSLNFRKGPRERRSSLSDRVAVEKIGGLNPVDTFKHATEELNRDVADHAQENHDAQVDIVS